MFFAINIRSEVGYLTLASAAFAVCLEVLRYLLKAVDVQTLKRMAVSFLMLCIMAGISVGAHKIHESQDGWDDFREFNAERVQFIDYLPLDYTSNRDLFDKIGWSEDLYNLVNHWFFMDETVNAETFRMINERKTPVPMGVKWALTHDFPRIGFQAVVWGGGVWRTYSEDRPYNLVFWGGSRYHSPLYYAQLEKNGLAHLYEKDFFRGNVYMLAAKEPNEMLVKVMQEKFPGCTYEITEERDEFIVYQFQNEE